MLFDWLCETDLIMNQLWLMLLFNRQLKDSKKAA